MLKLLKNASQIITVNTNHKNFKHGNSLNEIDVLTGHAIILENETIKDIIPFPSIKNEPSYSVIDLKNKIILPGLVECHTHTAFAGSRANEFKEKLKGKSYEEISEQGGGIISTVKAVRELSFEKLIKIIKPRIDYFISQGITTLEIKSGYGLDFENEIKLLEVINHLNKIYPIDIIPTFLGAHAYPPEFKEDHEKYIDIIINKMLPYITKNNLANFCDGFCEASAFSAQEVDLIFLEAKKLGVNLRLHTEQFNNLGGIETALKYNAVSVDHLEVLKDEQISILKNKDTVCVLLPGVSFFLDYQFAPARKLIDNNLIIALSTDYNPGSSNISSLSFIMSLAALKMKMTIEETISAVTINAAKALKLNDKIGSIEIGKNADFSIFDTNDYADIPYNIGKNLNCMTIKNGKIIYELQKN